MICHDDFDDTVHPWTTSCGHLFCETCTNFHFSFDRETPCPFCRTAIKRAQLFRLYFDYNNEEDADGQGTDREDLVARTEDVVKRCQEAVADPTTVDVDAIRVTVES